MHIACFGGQRGSSVVQCFCMCGCRRVRQRKQKAGLACATARRETAELHQCRKWARQGLLAPSAELPRSEIDEMEKPGGLVPSMFSWQCILPLLVQYSGVAGGDARLRCLVFLRCRIPYLIPYTGSRLARRLMGWALPFSTETVFVSAWRWGNTAAIAAFCPSGSDLLRVPKGK